MTIPTGIRCRARLATVWLLSACALCAFSGCRVFERPVAGAAQPALNWLAQFGADAQLSGTPLELNSIRPAPHTAKVQSGDLLEVTVSNLFQPEEPHTFPARVQENGSIEVPFLGQPVVSGLTRADIEKGLREEFQRQELLINPTVIVRNLEVPQVKVYVEGAVERPGMISLPREDASVYAALVTTGIKTNAGTHISVARPRRVISASPVAETAALFDVPIADEINFDAEPAEMTAEMDINADINADMNLDLATDIDMAVEAGLAGAAMPAANHPSASGGGSAPIGVEYDVIWFNAESDEDRRALIELRLGDGDVIRVSELVPPIQVLGAVQNPGSYNIPNSNAITLIDAVRLAGGVAADEDDLTVTLMRINESGWPGRKWSRSLKELEQDPQQAPSVRPGDVIHIERPAGSKLKQTVEGWLSK